MLNPVFSLANMRAVLPTVAPIADKLLERIRAQLPEGGGTRFFSSRKTTCRRSEADSALGMIGTAEVDVLPWAGRVTMDLLGGAVLGISLDALDPEKTKEHALTIRKVR